MKTLFQNLLKLSPLILIMFVAACQTTKQKYNPDLVYGLSDRALVRIGEQIGYDVDTEMGMSQYIFSKGEVAFSVWAHTDLVATTKVTHVADEPVRLSYHAPGGNAKLEDHIDLSKGVRMELVEERFREFVMKIDQMQK